MMRICLHPRWSPTLIHAYFSKAPSLLLTHVTVKTLGWAWIGSRTLVSRDWSSACHAARSNRWPKYILFLWSIIRPQVDPPSTSRALPDTEPSCSAIFSIFIDDKTWQLLSWLSFCTLFACSNTCHSQYVIRNRVGRYFRRSALFNQAMSSFDREMNRRGDARGNVDNVMHQLESYVTHYWDRRVFQVPKYIYPFQFFIHSNLFIQIYSNIMNLDKNKH